MAEITPVAGNGLLDRRAFLRRSGILITGYAVSPANAEPLGEAAWEQGAGHGGTGGHRPPLEI